MMWRSPTDCQQSEPVVVAVSGVAGSGKSTLGRAVATALRMPLLDLDSVTNPLLDALPAAVLGGHWLASEHRAAIRDGRYAALRAAAGDTLATAGCVVLVAPFTAELRGGPEWNLLREAVGARPRPRPPGSRAPLDPEPRGPLDADLRMVHLIGEPDLFAARRAMRAETRDEHRLPVALSPPAIPVITIDAELTPGQQLSRVLIALGRRSALAPDSALFGRDFDAVLFDLDGTLADSTASVLRSWRRFGREFGLPADAVAENHGRPARALLGRLLPRSRVAEALARITELEIADSGSVGPALGAREFFGHVPQSRRAVVTSGSAVLATARLHAAGLPEPAVMVTADDVRHGKPDPEPYLLAARRLGLDPSRCLAVEDAVAGIHSARAAGCAVLAVTGTSPAGELGEADLVTDGLDRLRLDSTAGTLRLRTRTSRRQPSGLSQPGNR